MTKPNSAEIIVILDRSGSMASIRKDMEGGFDSFIAEQRKLPGECSVTLVQFDDKYEVVYMGKALADVPPLDLVPRGSTALLDAVGKTTVATGERLAAMPEHERPARVLVVIITDGQENASMEHTKESVRQMVDHQRSAYQWEFVYFGANQDAFAEAAKMGINIAQNYAADAAGVKNASESLTRGTIGYRSGRGYSG